MSITIICIALYLAPTILYALFMVPYIAFGARTSDVVFVFTLAFLLGLTWPYALFTLVRARLILNSKDDHEH
jgi:hypothetical protein